MNLTDRPRRLRRDGIRELVRETELSAADLIAPVFVDATTDERVPLYDAVARHPRNRLTTSSATAGSVARMY